MLTKDSRSSTSVSRNRFAQCPSETSSIPARAGAEARAIRPEISDLRMTSRTNRLRRTTTGRRAFGSSTMRTPRRPTRSTVRGAGDSCGASLGGGGVGGSLFPFFFWGGGGDCLLWGGGVGGGGFFCGGGGLYFSVFFLFLWRRLSRHRGRRPRERCSPQCSKEDAELAQTMPWFKSDGSIWFTDPSYGIDSNMKASDPGMKCPAAKSTVRPKGRKLTAVAKGFREAERACLSRTKSCLYIAIPAPQCAERTRPISGVRGRTRMGPASTRLPLRNLPVGVRRPFESHHGSNVWTSAGTASSAPYVAGRLACSAASSPRKWVATSRSAASRQQDLHLRPTALFRSIQFAGSVAAEPVTAEESGAGARMTEARGNEPSQPCRFSRRRQRFCQPRHARYDYGRFQARPIEQEVVDGRSTSRLFTGLGQLGPERRNRVFMRWRPRNRSRGHLRLAWRHAAPKRLVERRTRMPR